MAKPKKTENMSVLDYFYKKLNWLVNKIETSSGGKISKRDLLIYSLIIIFILSVWFGGVIGAFTFILAVATIWNIWITQGLLKESKRVSRQSRDIFFADMVVRISQYIAELYDKKGLAVSGELKDLVEELRTVPYQEALEGALNSINKELSKRFMNIWASFLAQYMKSHKRIYKKIKEKEDQLMMGIKVNNKTKKQEDQ